MVTKSLLGPSWETFTGQYAFPDSQIGCSMKGIKFLIFCSFVALLLVSCEEINDAQHVENAREHLAKRNYTSAAIELKNALKLNPENSQGRVLLGKVHFLTGNYSAAIKEFMKGQALGAEDNQVLPYLSQSQIQMRSFDDVLGLGIENLSDENKGQVLAAKAFVLLLTSENEEAKSNISRALKLTDNAAYIHVIAARIALAERANKEAQLSARKALELDKNYAQAWIVLGDIDATEHNPVAAEKAFTEAITLQPWNFLSRIKRVATNLSQKDLVDAQKDLDVLNKQLPDNPGVQYSQGLVHLASKNHEEAKDSFAVAMLRKNDYPLSEFYSALVNYKLGNVEYAVKLSRQFYTAYPKHNGGRKLLAKIEFDQQNYVYVEEILGPLIGSTNANAATMRLLAQAYLKQGKSTEALALLEAVIKLNPDSSAAKIDLGLGLIGAGREHDGFTQLQDVIALDPSKYQADIYQIGSYLQLNHLDRALDAAIHFKERHANIDVSHNLLGIVYLARQNPAKAKDAFLESWSINKGNKDAALNLSTFALRKNAFDTARAYMDEVNESHKNSLEILLKYAEIATLAGNPEQAVQHLEKAIKHHPGVLKPKMLLAQHYLAEGKFTQVAGLMGTLNNEVKKQPEIMDLLIQQYLIQGKFSEAELMANKLIENVSYGHRGYYLLAQSLLGQGKTLLAVNALKESKARNKLDLSTRISLLKQYHGQQNFSSLKSELIQAKALGFEDKELLRMEIILANHNAEFARGVQLAKQMNKLYPGSSSVYLLASQNEKNGDGDAAIEVLTTWLDQNPDDFQANFHLAEYHKTQNNKPLAVRYYEKANKLQPDNVAVLNNMAWILRQSHPERALQYIEKAHKLKPKSKTILDTLALVYLENGDGIGAEGVMRDALLLDPKNPTLRFHQALILASTGKESAARDILKAILVEGEPFVEKKQALTLYKKLNQ